MTVPVAAALLALQLPGDRWLSTDKIKHFFMSAFVQSVAYSALRAAEARHEHAIAGASAATAVAGLGKEWYDWRSGRRFSLRDLAWDAAGAATASAVLGRTHR